jgi:hypothetical protein
MLSMAVGAVLALAGCENIDPTASYSSRSLYRTDIRNVFVEMFESESFRRQVEFELTRAVSEQLELHSPYKVVSDRRKADTILKGTINRIDEKSLARQRDLDRPVASEVMLVVTIRWEDQRTGDYIIDDQRLKVSGNYAALLGASRDSAAKEAANELAVRIVETMEEPW